MRLALVVPDLATNALGRAFCWWLLASELGWPLEVIGPSSTGTVWQPLIGTGFEAVCREVEPRALEDAVADRRGSVDIVVAIKPMPGSFGVVYSTHRGTPFPFLLDIDDADLERWIDDLPLHARLGLVRPHRLLRGEHTFQLHALRRRAREAPSTVSNPQLQQMYGGQIVPHVRPERSAGRPHATDRPVVAFVGTPRPHKGLGVLREAIARLASEGFTLVVTNPAPRDSHPWESWVGPTTLEQGRDILDRSDVAVIPSLATPYARAQFPVKIIDAMISGRSVIASDLPVLRWALAGTGMVTEPGSVSRLVDALRTVRDPTTRERMGAAARRQALDRFNPAVVAQPWAELLTRTVTGGGTR